MATVFDWPIPHKLSSLPLVCHFVIQRRGFPLVNRWHSSIMYFLIYGISSRARKNNAEEQVKVILMFLLNVQAPGIGTRNHHIFSLNEINREKFKKKRTIGASQFVRVFIKLLSPFYFSVNVYMLCHWWRPIFASLSKLGLKATTV